MNSRFYSDHRDLVKWGALLRLAEHHSLASVIQIAYLTAEDPPIVIKSELGDAVADPRILHHFRNVRRIAELSDGKQPSIQAFTDRFDWRQRLKYTHAALAAVRSLPSRPSAVFLDPDTGIANKPKSSLHVTPEEVSEFWSVLQPEDWLVLYQHSARTRGWLEARRTTFAQAVEGAPVLTLSSPEVASDVVLFASCRRSTA